MIRRLMFHVTHLDVMDKKLEFDCLLREERVRYYLANIPHNEVADGITLLVDGRVFLSMGFFQIIPGEAEVWLFPSIYVEKQPLLFIKEVKSYLDILSKMFSWQRVRTVTRIDPQHRKWMHLLGFVEEGIIDNYFQGESYIVSSKSFG